MKSTKLVHLSKKPLALAVMSASVMAFSSFAQAEIERTLPVRTLESVKIEELGGVQIEETKSIIDENGQVITQTQVTESNIKPLIKPLEVTTITSNGTEPVEPAVKSFAQTKASQEAAETQTDEMKALEEARKKAAEDKAKEQVEAVGKANEADQATETKKPVDDTTMTEGQAVSGITTDTSNDESIEKIQNIGNKKHITTNLSEYANKVNSATWSQGMRKNTAMTVKLQALLDWNHASPGPIDGGWGMNSIKALTNFQAMSGLPKTGKLDTATWDALTRNIDPNQPVLMGYTLTKADTNYKFTNIPSGYEAKSKLSAMNYNNIYEKIAEEYHMDVNYLKKLNKGKNFVAGETITVYNPGKPLNQRITRVVANKADRTLYAYNGNKLVATYPTTVGSAATPSPHGTFKIANRVKKPHYKATVGEGDDKQIYMLKPGPNSPVGIVWMGLSKPTYGLHGSPLPEGISRQASHGCIRLTNWDVLEVYANIKTGATVVLE